MEQRYDIGSILSTWGNFCPKDFVLYDAHLSALAASEARVRELEETVDKWQNDALIDAKTKRENAAKDREIVELRLKLDDCLVKNGELAKEIAALTTALSIEHDQGEAFLVQIKGLMGEIAELNRKLASAYENIHSLGARLTRIRGACDDILKEAV